MAYEFPKVIKMRIDSEIERKISYLKSSEQKEEEIVDRKIINIKIKDPLGDIVGIIGFVAIISFFIGVSTCNNMREEYGLNEIIYGIESFVSSFITISIIAVVLFFAVLIAIEIINDNSRNKAIQKKSISKKSVEQEIERLKIKAQEEYADYSKNFELEAQNQSVRFAESELAKEVIDWMTNGFSNMIKTADRREHITSLNVPFEFKVFKNKITCVLGDYDFNIKRCSYLESPLEQAALARALASAIQLNIVMAFPQDISGTAINVSISHEYSFDSVNMRLYYTAPNGFYQTVKKWG